MSDRAALPARPEALQTLHEMLDRFWGAIETGRGERVPERVRHGLGTAVSEVATNIIRYAQAETFDFALTLDEWGKVEALFQDGGAPFRGVPDGDFDPDMLAEGGMGLALAKRSLDVLDYSRSAEGVNSWRLVIALSVPS